MKILVTGSTGFVGNNLRNRLKDSKDTVYYSNSTSCNLLIKQAVNNYMNHIRPDAIIHLAARVGGIQANAANPGQFMYENLTMGVNLIHAAYTYKVKQFIMIGTVCSYPKYTPVPFKEEDLWNGYPEETNAPYGIAKKSLMEMLLAYYNQYGMQSVNLIPVNLYGPHDCLDPNVSHVIPALIKKVLEAKKFDYPSIEVWGDGSVSREFLYVDDCIDAIIKALTLKDYPWPLNIGTGKEIFIKDLVSKICELVDWHGEIRYQTNKPNGQPRRCLDVSRAKRILQFEAKTSLNNGLKYTIDYFRNKI